MNSLSIRKQSILILLFAWLTYTLSYLGRVNYSSCMIEIVYETGISRTSAGLVASILSLAYAIGQLTIGFFINRFSSVKIITLELLIVAFINLLFPICIGKWYMFILWGINGFAQSTVLCTLTKIFTENLKEPNKKRR